MPHIDYYFTTVSPFCYLAGTRLEEIAARHGASVTYKPLDAIALFARTGGQALKDRHESRQSYRTQEIRRQAIRRGLPITQKPAFWPVNPAPSSYAIIAAQAAGGGDLGGLVHATFHACWAEERDISDDAVLRAMLEAHGFDPKLVDSGLLTGAETYARNLEEAVAAGVFGMPFYVIGSERFWGQDKLEDLDLYLAGRL